jgi:hypothetical protein
MILETGFDSAATQLQLRQSAPRTPRGSSGDKQGYGLYQVLSGAWLHRLIAGNRNDSARIQLQSGRR